MFSSMLSLLGSLRGGSSFVTNSLRFRSSASAYLSRTPSVAGNRQTFTWSAWVKRGALTTGTILGAGTGTTYTQLSFSGDSLFFSNTVSAVVPINAQTTAVFRDPSAWYHVVLYVDTTQAVNTNGVRIYVNGVNQTLTFTAYASGSICSLNNTVEQALGRVLATQYFDGYLTDVNFIDGQALTPASFGQIESTTGVWSPKQYVGSYGTNGFYLKFADASAATAAAIGKDSSGNGNNWTPSGISVTAGATYDSMIDVPVNYADGGNGRGNYAVLNPVETNRGTITNGNLLFSTGAGYAYGTGTIIIPTTGKWLFEVTFNSNTTASNYNSCGIVNSSFSKTGAFSSSGSYGVNDASASFGQSFVQNGSRQGSITLPAGTVIQCLIDRDANTLTFTKNGTLQTGTGSTVTIPASVDLFAVVGEYGINADANFGQRPFTYTPPAGFRALNTNNLPTPSIVNGANFMAATTYTGNAAARSLSNAVNSVSFQPDLVWIKSRTPGATNHALFDSVRGTTKYLSSNTTTGETTLAQSLTAFGADGFSLGTDTTLVNANANSYIAWQWKAGGAAVSNTQGTITSQVSANTTAGFSVVTYTGTGANATVGHGLGVAPKMVICKSRSLAGENWPVYHASITNPATNQLRLNATTSVEASTNWNSTAPTSSIFSISSGGAVGSIGITYVAYCFAEIAGFSRFGSYTGNGSTDGPFVFCGFRPRLVIVKRTDTTGDWRLWDSARDTYNAAPNVLFSNLSNVEASSAASPIDVLSNGFKLRGTGGDPNTTGGTYIFAAFAEVPSKYALAR